MNIFPPFVSPLESFSKLKKNLNNRLVLVPQTVHIMHHMERSGGLGQGPWSADTESQSPSWCVWCKHWWKGIHGRLFNMHIHWEDILALNSVFLSPFLSFHLYFLHMHVYIICIYFTWAICNYGISDSVIILFGCILKCFGRRMQKVLGFQEGT